MDERRFGGCEKCTYAEEDARKGERAEQELPFARLLDVGGFGDRGDDLAGEDAVGEGYEVVAGDGISIPLSLSKRTPNKFQQVLGRAGKQILTGTKHHKSQSTSSNNTSTQAYTAPAYE